MFERFGHLWLGEPIVEYLAGLVAQGYSKVTLEGYGRKLARFAAYVEQKDGSKLVYLPERVAPFLDQLKIGRHWIIQWRSLLNRFVGHLRGSGLLPRVDLPAESGRFADLVSEYSGFLAEHRGVSLDGVAAIRSCCRAFLTHVETRGITALGTLSPAIIHDFIAAEGRRFARRTMSGRCSALRGFLSFLHRRNRTPSDFSTFVVAPVRYAQEQCPRFLTRAEVRTVLATVDRRSALGLRDYAMLTLLATYGLRGIEVIRLELGDINWRKETLRIRGRKAGNETVYPLAPSVGRAVLAYLKRARPKTSTRRLFVSVAAPFQGLSRASTLGHVVRKCLRWAGIRVERPGTHTLRYSCAQALLEDRTPLKTIGDYLGHRNPASTQRYTMIALDELRAVAMGDGEDLL